MPLEGRFDGDGSTATASLLEESPTARLRDVMTTDIVTVFDSTPVATAVAAMRTHRMRHLVIVDRAGNYLGLLAQRHLLFDLLVDLEVKVGDLTGYLMSADARGG